MKHIVIDTSVILSYPAITMRRSATVKMYIPIVVMQELGRFNRPSNPEGDFRNLVKKAIEEGNLIPLSHEMTTAEDSRIRGLPDAQIIMAAQWLAQKEKDVYLATNDKEIQYYCSPLGIHCITGKELLTILYSEVSTVVEELQDRIKALKKENFRYISLSSIVSVLVSLLANFTIAKFAKIIEFLTFWGVLAVAPLLGVGLFWMRAKFRLTYGISEFFIGVIMTSRVVFPQFNIASIQAVTVLQFLGGLYVMVRGLDNVEKGLKGTRLQPRWDNWFSANK